MRTILKKALRHSPLALRKGAALLNERLFAFYSNRKEARQYPNLPSRTATRKKIRNILIYHVSGMSFGGTEKNLQFVANMLADTHNVFFMYSNKGVSKNRIASISPKVRLIEFNYDHREPHFPYFIEGMNPHIKSVLALHDIDLIITADSGHSQYPISAITNVPVILINIFGSPALQKNIRHTIYISNEVREKAQFYTGPLPSSVLYIPSSDPIEESERSRATLRESFGIPESAFVFGRVGRNEDSIFDPIGISAFKKVVAEYPDAHYVVMSPMPVLERIVRDESIPNVHFIPPSSNEVDIWNFHFAIDALAHFRHDGESCGLNIAESMLAGNPIITHRSHIWNAHTEYLDLSFSRIADRNNAEQYAKFMKEFIRIRSEDPVAWNRMRDASRAQARKHFSLKSYSEKLHNILSNI